MAHPKTIGDHLCNRRLKLGLLQREVAEQLGVTEESISYWEINLRTPGIEYIPKIIQFLNYCPIPIDVSTLGGEIYAYRLHHGLSYAAMGRLMGVHATTIAGWEKDEHKPFGERLKKLQQLLEAK